MGLDMYLYRRTYVQNWDHMGPEERHEITVSKGGKPTAIDTKRIVYIIEQAAYWRKANAIHAWLVGERDDNCEEFYVPTERLAELVKLCKTVLADPKKAEELLPTQSGFFFGSTEYDEGYIADLQDTVKQLEPLLSDKGADYRYRASW